MILLENIIFYLEFLFEGCIAYMYCVSIFENKYKNGVTFLAFMASSSLLYIIYYFRFVSANIFACILLVFLLIYKFFKTNIGTAIFHSCIFSAALAFSEMITLPVVNLLLNQNYMSEHSFFTEIVVSTISKLLLFLVMRIIAFFAQKENKRSKGGTALFALPVASLVCFLAISYLSESNTDIVFTSIILSVCTVVLILANAVVFMVYEHTVTISNTLTNLTLSEQKNELDYEYFKVLQDNYDNSRIIVHDSKHHLGVIHAIAESNNDTEIIKYINSITNQDYYSGTSHITGNKILDIVIYQKCAKCNNENINFSFRHNNNNLGFVNDLDLCCIVSNILDNAIESAENSAGVKNIDLEIYSSENTHLYFLEVNNTCTTPPKIIDGNLISTKHNKKYHGIGLFSVKKAIKKYNGDLYFEYLQNEKIFKTTIMLNEPVKDEVN